MAVKRDPEKELLWRDVLDRQAASGVSIREFCRKERVSEPSFYSWRRKLNSPEGGKTKTVRRPTTNGSKKERQFIPLALVDSPTSMELLHPLGYRIRLTGEVNPAVLSNLLDVLDARLRR